MRNTQELMKAKEQQLAVAQDNATRSQREKAAAQQLTVTAQQETAGLKRAREADAKANRQEVLKLQADLRTLTHENKGLAAEKHKKEEELKTKQRDFTERETSLKQEVEQLRKHQIEGLTAELAGLQTTEELSEFCERLADIHEQQIKDLVKVQKLNKKATKALQRKKEQEARSQGEADRTKLADGKTYRDMVLRLQAEIRTLTDNNNGLAAEKEKKEEELKIKEGAFAERETSLKQEVATATEKADRLEATLEEVLQKEEARVEAALCVICQAVPYTTVFPCGHMCACGECAEDLMRRRRSSRRCPMCREQIGDYTTVYQA
ncbi:unnamed protein product [Vitrella brassicaformis CCMP3155]|uniref:RING-type domain-containing protein n=1 Tax=Vitrella brassicaformis (strain CCMP3155) TaxID=1169540 RepID=A0A0G4FRK7_VITBC|nr:unnamed protein product [Vitrella brassicaformis CCMP3155]|eukprot:CEM16901.1 unnamed protein product [Vitrella brassicaformis CCMP3155]